MMIVWGLGEKLFCTVLSSEYRSCAQWYAHTCEQCS